MSDEEKGNGLFCFLDQGRPCGPECMAYLTHPPSGPDFQGQQFANCLLLVNAHRTGKHLVVLARDVAVMSGSPLPAPPKVT